MNRIDLLPNDVLEILISPFSKVQTALGEVSSHDLLNFNNFLVDGLYHKSCICGFNEEDEYINDCQVIPFQTYNVLFEVSYQY